MLKRYQDWPTRLQACVDAHRHQTFRYGSYDCCTFSADCIEAMTGVDLASWFRGRYRTRKEAFNLIRERTGHTGVGAIAEYEAQEHGLREVLASYAQRGDMALVGSGLKAVLGVVSLSGTDIMCLTHKQVVRVCLCEATKVWRV